MEPVRLTATVRVRRLALSLDTVATDWISRTASSSYSVYRADRLVSVQSLGLNTGVYEKALSPV